MKAAAQQEGDVHRMQAWAGQSAAMAQAEPAANVVRRLWEGAQEFLT
jgi:nitronate monooxygenase